MVQRGVFPNQTDSCWSTNRDETEKNDGVMPGSEECALFWCHGESIRASVGTGTRRSLRRLHPRSTHRIQPGIGLSFLPTLAQRSPVRQISASADAFLPRIREERGAWGPAIDLFFFEFYRHGKLTGGFIYPARASHGIRVGRSSHSDSPSTFLSSPCPGGHPQDHQQTFRGDGGN
jgi:hypothetical protein